MFAEFDRLVGKRRSINDFLQRISIKRNRKDVDLNFASLRSAFRGRFETVEFARIVRKPKQYASFVQLKISTDHGKIEIKPY